MADVKGRGRSRRAVDPDKPGRTEVRGAFTARGVLIEQKDVGTAGALGAVMVKESMAARASMLTLQGKTQEEIAGELGVSLAEVRALVRTVRKHWLDSSLVAYDAVRAEQLAKLEAIERKQWETIESLEQVEGEKAEGDWWYKRHNAAWTRIIWAFEQKCKIFGLYAPQEVISWKAEAQAQGFDPETIYRVLVHEMANIIDGTATEVIASNGQHNGNGSGGGDRGSAFLAEPVETDTWPD